MNALALGPLWLSLKLATVTTLLLLLLCIPAAYAMSRARDGIRLPLQTLFSMPLVLPPSVLGFYLLLTFSPAYAVGHFLGAHFGLNLAFTFSGLVVASILFSAPFMLNPLMAGFDALPKRWSEAAAVLGKSPWQTWIKVLLPNLRPALLSGAALSFAHTLGEFGVVLMIGGKLPGKTLTASIAVYDEVEGMRFASAHVYAAILGAFSFAMLLALFAMNRKRPPKFGPS